MSKASTKRDREFRTRQRSRQYRQRGGRRQRAGRPKGTRTPADRSRDYRQRLKEKRELLFENHTPLDENIRKWRTSPPIKVSLYPCDFVDRSDLAIGTSCENQLNCLNGPTMEALLTIKEEFECVTIKEEPFEVVDVCYDIKEETTENEGDPLSHTTANSNDSLYKCNVCNKSFIHLIDLKRHQAIHRS